MTKQAKEVYSKFYRDTHKKEIRLYMKAYREKYPEKRNTHDITYRNKHREEINKREKEYYQNHKEEIKTWWKTYRKSHPECNRKTHLKHYYNLSIKEYNNLLLDQKGVCKVCGTSPNGKNLHIDHNHLTGKIRGLLCSSCNMALGQLKEDPIIIRSLLKYVLDETKQKL